MIVNFRDPVANSWQIDRQCAESLRFAKVELAHPLCEFFLRKAAARAFLGIQVSFSRQFQVIPPQNVVQHWLVDLRLLKQLLDPRQILVSADARRDGDDVFRPKNFCRVIRSPNAAGYANCGGMPGKVAPRVRNISPRCRVECKRRMGTRICCGRTRGTKGSKYSRAAT